MKLGNIIAQHIDAWLVKALDSLKVPVQVVGHELPIPLFLRYHLCFVERLPTWPFLRVERCPDANDRKRPKLVFHRMLRGDDRAKGIHSHPWRFWSVVVLGWYREVVVTRFQSAEIRAVRTRGILSAMWHEATYEHIVTAVSDVPCWTLAYLGPLTNAWGFPQAGETVRDANGEKVAGFDLEKTR